MSRGWGAPTTLSTIECFRNELKPSRLTVPSISPRLGKCSTDGGACAGALLALTRLTVNAIVAEAALAKAWLILSSELAKHSSSDATSGSALTSRRGRTPPAAILAATGIGGADFSTTITCAIPRALNCRSISAMMLPFAYLIGLERLTLEQSRLGSRNRRLSNPQDNAATGNERVNLMYSFPAAANNSRSSLPIP